MFILFLVWLPTNCCHCHPPPTWYEELITASNLTVTEVTSVGEKRDAVEGFGKGGAVLAKLSFALYNPYIYIYIRIYGLNYIYIYVLFFVYISS